MIRIPSLLFAAVLLTSASAFAADTPDPNATGAAALPSGSNPSSPPAADANKDKTVKGEPSTPPDTGGENKGKPVVTPQ